MMHRRVGVAEVSGRSLKLTGTLQGPAVLCILLCIYWLRLRGGMGIEPLQEGWEQTNKYNSW